jgi:hypothetical protein
MPKKNSLGFMENQLKILLNYCKAVRNTPRLSYNKFHRQYSPYSRIQSTIELVNKAYRRGAISGPFLYANAGIEVHLMDDVDNPRELLEECKNDEKTTIAIALRGEWSFIRFQYGASMLQYADSIIPNCVSNNDIGNLTIDEQGKGRLPLDPYPHGWSEDHWNVYGSMGSPRDTTYRKVGQRVGLHWKTVRKYYEEILEQCKVLTCFFPLGIEGHSPHIITFKTDYELGLIKGLRKLCSTTYVYKSENTFILDLHLQPYPEIYKESTKRFVHLEEIGLVHDLHVSTPYVMFNRFI